MSREPIPGTWEAKCPKCNGLRRDHRYRCEHCGDMGWG